MTRKSVFAVVFVLLFSPLPGMGQHTGHRSGTTGVNAGPAVEPDSPDVVSLERSVAMQARPDQIGQFQKVIQSTATACTQAHDLQQREASANSADLSQAAIRLKDAVDDAQSDNRKFVSSLSDVQVSGLKKLTSALAKANSAVTKESKALSGRLEKTPVDSGRLISTAGQLDKALTAFQSAQNHLAQEMGIPPH